MAVNSQCLMYREYHSGWKERCAKEINQRNKFENILADNISEIEGNVGQLTYPSNSIHPLLTSNHVIG